MERDYVARGIPGLETVAAEHLGDQGFRPFVPAGALRRARRGRVGPAFRVVFPGYIFIEKLDLDGTLRWQSINGTRGVVRLLPVHTERPSPLPIGWLAGLKDVVASGEYDEKSMDELMRRYVKDDLIAIRSGPFEGHTGRFEYYHKGCLHVLLRLLSREIGVSVPAHQVMPASLEAA
jgi:transcription antitermination factor NusG